MAHVYSVQLVSTTGIMDGFGGPLFTAPVGFRTVLRDLQLAIVTLDARENVKIFVQDSHLDPVGIVKSPAGAWNDLIVQWEGRVNMNPGDQLRFITTSSGFADTFYVLASGYQLELP